MRAPHTTGPRRRRRGCLRDPVRHSDELPDGSALRPRGDPLGLGAAAALQPGARRERGRDALDRRLRRRARLARRHPAHVRADRGGRTPLVEAGVFPLALGGDHSVTLAELRVLARKHGPLALLQLDAHGDTWDEYFGQRYFHGTTFLRAFEEKLIEPAASVQAGLRGSLYGAEDLESARAMGFAVLPSTSCGRSGPAASRAWCASEPGAGRSFSRSTSTSSTRPSLRHGDTGGRRPLDSGGARLPTRAGWDRPRRRGTWSRSRLPSTARASRRRSQRRTSLTSCSACARSLGAPNAMSTGRLAALCGGLLRPRSRE